MKAVVFSIGEPTTELCEWSVKRQGFDPVIYYDPKTTLWQKLKRLYEEFDEPILRVDADVICNGKIKYLQPQKGILWTMSHAYDWYKQDIVPCSVGVMTAEAIQTCRMFIDEFEHDSRPETRMWRLDVFHQPRKCMLYKTVVGLHGYGQVDLDRVKNQKLERKQDYDWELSEKVAAL